MLPTLLSHALAAFTIEFDNEFEQHMPHRTTNHGLDGSALDAPWLVSLAMWSNCMQFVGEQGVTVHRLEDLARTKTNLNGMERWGYVVVAPDPADHRPRPPRSSWLIRATPAGKRAQEVWRPLFGIIEERWAQRFGKPAIDQLRQSLRSVVDQLDVGLPDCLPILGYGLFSHGPESAGRSPATREVATSSVPQLSTLLARALLAFALEFERESTISLAISVNVLRVLEEKGVRIRDLPLLTGVSKEVIKVALGVLQKTNIAIVEPEQSAKPAKVARLTPKGRAARDRYVRLLDSIDSRWRERFGEDAIRRLCESLEQLTGDGTAEHSPLFRGLTPYPNGWRASVPEPATLPHYPMVTHRGGFPDGS